MTHDQRKLDCLDDLRVYYGLDPYTKHMSAGSGVFYMWIKKKYKQELIDECEEILNVKRDI